MSESQSQSDSPALGDRSNWWGEDDDQELPGGHAEIEADDPAEYIAFAQLQQLTDPVCNETGRPLSEPEFYLPKQHWNGHGFDEFRSHRHRRRVEPVSGRINWGESTKTDIPEVGYGTYIEAVGRYLMERHSNDALTLTNIEQYVEYADQIWADPSQNSHGSLTKFVSYVREHEQD